MILQKIDDLYHLCDIEAMPRLASLANIDASQRGEVYKNNQRTTKELDDWIKRFEHCKKIPTLPEHQDYFSEFELDEPVVENMDYLIARIWVGGRSVKSIEGIPYDYETYYVEKAVPIGENLEKYIKMEPVVTYSTNGIHKEEKKEPEITKKNDWREIGRIFVADCKESKKVINELSRLSPEKLLKIVSWFKKHV